MYTDSIGVSITPLLKLTVLWDFYDVLLPSVLIL